MKTDVRVRGLATTSPEDPMKGYLAKEEKGWYEAGWSMKETLSLP